MPKDSESVGFIVGAGLGGKEGLHAASKRIGTGFLKGSVWFEARMAEYDVLCSSKTLWREVCFEPSGTAKTFSGLPSQSDQGIII